MMNVKVGQVLWLRARLENSGVVSSCKHPYLILKLNEADGVIEVGQCDKTRGKGYKVMFECNKQISVDNPKETVLSERSFIQMDKKIQIEYFDGISKYFSTTDTLSRTKFDEVLSAYIDYQENHHIDENKQIFLTEHEIKELND